MIGSNNSYNAVITVIVKEMLKPTKESSKIIQGARSQLRYLDMIKEELK